jgi:signal peptidase II
LVHNEGTTFGLLKEYAPYKTILIVKSLMIIVLLVLFRTIPMFIQQSRHQLISRLFLLFLIGGSMGNIIDRLLDKRVTDFIDIGMNGHRWHIFNVADVFQCAGGMAILFFVIWEYREKHRSASIEEHVTK